MQASDKPAPTTRPAGRTARASPAPVSAARTATIAVLRRHQRRDLRADAPRARSRPRSSARRTAIIPVRRAGSPPPTATIRLTNSASGTVLDSGLGSSRKRRRCPRNQLGQRQQVTLVASARRRRSARAGTMLARLRLLSRACSPSASRCRQRPAGGCRAGCRSPRNRARSAWRRAGPGPRRSPRPSDDQVDIFPGGGMMRLRRSRPCCPWTRTTSSGGGSARSR